MIHTAPHVICVLSQNLHQPAPRILKSLRTAVETVKPDLLLLQNIDGPVGELQVAELTQGLGFEMAIAPTGGGGSNLVAWHPAVFQATEVDVPEAERLEAGFGYCAVELSLCDIHHPYPLSAISCALSRYSAPRAAQQAQQLGEIAHRTGGLGLIAGAINHLPIGDPPPDWDALPGYRRMALCKLRTSATEPWTGDDQVARVLAAGGMTDVAAYIADLAATAHCVGLERDRTHLRAPTTSEPRGIRADQIHVTAALTTAVETCWCPDTAVSSHYAIATEFDLAKFDINAMRTYV